MIRGKQPASAHNKKPAQQRNKAPRAQMPLSRRAMETGSSPQVRRYTKKRQGGPVHAQIKLAPTSACTSQRSTTPQAMPATPRTEPAAGRIAATKQGATGWEHEAMARRACSSAERDRIDPAVCRQKTQERAGRVGGARGGHVWPGSASV